MAKNDIEKRYHWIKVEERVWQDRRIKRLLKLDPAYLIMYMRLATMTANSAGIFTYEGLDDDIEAEIALAIDADDDDVREAVRWYTKLGLAEISEDRTVLAVSSYDVGIYAGQSSAQALNKAAQREKVKRGQQNAGSGQDEDKAGTDAGQNEDKSRTKVGQVEDKTRTKVGQNEDKKADICTLRDRERESVRVRAEEPGKPGFPDDDDDLPFADISDEERINQGVAQVADKWNAIVKVLKSEGIEASSLVLSQTKATSDRSRKLRLAVRDYGADVIVRCLQAYEQDDWWTGRTTKPQYAGKARNLEYTLDNFGKLLRLADEMGLIEAADTAGGLRYRPTDTSPVQTQQAAAEEPKERPILSLCPKGYTGPRVIVNGIEKPALKQ